MLVGTGEVNMTHLGVFRRFGAKVKQDRAIGDAGDQSQLVHTSVV
jgi:hypothetical protein